MAYAHTPKEAGKPWHLLADHLRDTALLTGQFAGSFAAADLGYYLGLWHDLGKYNPKFQHYLVACDKGLKPKKLDHKVAGTLLAHDVFEENPATSHLCWQLAMLIQGHHGGLKRKVDADNWLIEMSDKDGEVIKDCWRQADADMPNFDSAGAVSVPTYVSRLVSEADHYAVEFFLRMLYSALVDADSLDTEHYSEPDKPRYRRNVVTQAHWRQFEQHHNGLEKKGSDALNQALEEIYQSCIKATTQPTGFFRLTVPTGGGKTLSGLAFAIQHALQQDPPLERIIVAVPYLSITEQTTEVYRKVFTDMEAATGTPVVLEHYSSSDAFKEDEPRGDGQDDPGDFDPHKVWLQLAAENWDAPIIVTTTVQLFESMFARKRGRCRKLHNLARSVIILDEAQSLPAQLLTPILDGLKQLCANYGSSVIFSTATQPEFDIIAGFTRTADGSPGLAQREIVPNYAAHFASHPFNRVTYRWETETTQEWSKVAEWMREQKQGQALAVVNTKNDAVALLDALADKAALHLSTRLCGAHRRWVLEEVGRRLNEGEHCLLVSTQVVEAGVDLDFPCVLRALGPLDSIVQAAGRCNRRNKLQKGEVIIFNPREGKEPPGTLIKGRQITELLRRRGNLDPNKPTIFADYYARLFQVIDPDAELVQPVRFTLDYPEVAHRFRMIKDDTYSVVVLYSAEENKPEGERDEAKIEQDKEMIRGWLRDLRERKGSARQLLRLLQPYTVAIRRNEAERLKEKLWIVEIPDANIGEWKGKYDLVRGLVAPDGYNLEALVIGG